MISRDSKVRIAQGAEKARAIIREKKNLRTQSFKKECLNCKASIPYDRRRAKYCSKSCAAIANNAKFPKRKAKPVNNCLFCGKGNCVKFCSRECQNEFNYHGYVQKWKEGLISGLNTNGVVSPTIKRYLREKFNNQCCECGWSKVNEFTGKVPLFADHVDGNWKNNTEGNLRLLCGCCDSLTATYCGANKGKGRNQRK